MKIAYSFFLILITSSALAQAPRPTLKDASVEINSSLPEVYDHVTKLMRTTVENEDLVYHFLIDANQKEYDFALPKVKTQILSTICKRSTERSILKGHRANIIYRYENVKGMSLGEFMVNPSHCSN